MNSDADGTTPVRTFASTERCRTTYNGHFYTSYPLKIMNKQQISRHFFENLKYYYVPLNTENKELSINITNKIQYYGFRKL